MFSCLILSTDPRAAAGWASFLFPGVRFWDRYIFLQGHLNNPVPILLLSRLYPHTLLLLSPILILSALSALFPLSFLCAAGTW